MRFLETAGFKICITEHQLKQTFKKSKLIIIKIKQDSRILQIKIPNSSKLLSFFKIKTDIFSLSEP